MSDCLPCKLHVHRGRLSDAERIRDDLQPPRGSIKGSLAYINHLVSHLRQGYDRAILSLNLLTYTVTVTKVFILRFLLKDR